MGGGPCPVRATSSARLEAIIVRFMLHPLRERCAHAQGTTPAPNEQGQRGDAARHPSCVLGPRMRVCSLVGVRHVVDVEFTGQQVGLVAGGHRGGHRQHAGLGGLGQHDLVLVVALLLGLELGAADLELDLRAAHRAVVGKAVEVQRDLLAAEHADELEGLGHGREARQRLADGRGAASPWSWPGPAQAGDATRMAAASTRGQGLREVHGGCPEGFVEWRHGRCSLRQKAQGLAPRGDRRCELDAGACGLAFGLGRFGLDAQACRQVGLAQPEGLVEEAARLAGQLRTPLGGISCVREDSTRTRAASRSAASRSRSRASWAWISMASARALALRAS
jgi:hypothetical protein